MVIGILTIRLGIEYAQSLKDKRQVVKSLKERIKGKFNVGVAETADLETWNRATLGVVTCSNERNVVENALNHVINYVEADGRATLEDFLLDIFPYMPTEADEEAESDYDTVFMGQMDGVADDTNMGL